MKKNISIETARTHQGAPAAHVNAEQQLRRSVMACMLWEDTFYEEGKSIAQRIAESIRHVKPEVAAEVAVEARERMNLRHAPLWVVREMARLDTHKHLVARTLERIIQRADELTEYLALYWLDGRCPVSAQSKLGLARAFGKFNEYALAKYNRDGKIKLRDVLFLCHPKPKDAEQDALWKRLIKGELAVPDTWEVAISASKGADKKSVWERLLQENKLGALALLRNLRNMAELDVDKAIMKTALECADYSRVLPFRFVAAAKAAPQYEELVDAAMLRTVGTQPKLRGKTVVIIDVSGSMYGGAISEKSDMNRALAACALGAIAREMCEETAIYATAGNDYSRVHATALVPPRRGMALVDAIYGMCYPLGGGGIFLNQACKFVAENERTADRTIVITDEQDCAADRDAPSKATPLGKGYLINVATYKNGIGYGRWTHVDGFSESVLQYISAVENPQSAESG